ncbi:hypothetical protein OG897_25425 [Streptomyces sp. NBC_00237]|uniref:hypothetical protein n=1 Tax=Streptomyces sp. NBC_00237 TaxID=2975687 RepID=UPI002251A3E8|nr:hypothetical protein [Streptomyces sp. NBC_00237]MCX5204784.1 hypothetical protein [Streptomyces sp. NBC_00237]
MSVSQLKVTRAGLGAVSLGIALAVCAPTASASVSSSSSPASVRASAPTAFVAAHGVGGKVTARHGQFVREHATSSSRKLGSYRDGAIVRLACKVRGQNIHGNDIWFKLWDRSGWLSAKYVQNFGHVNWCGHGHRALVGD